MTEYTYHNNHHAADGTPLPDQWINHPLVQFGDQPGTTGNDNLRGKVLFGWAGNDYLKANAGNAWIQGGLGNDVIEGSDGNDHLYGGPGNDIIMGYHGNDIIDGGSGTDTVDYHRISDATHEVIVDLAAGWTRYSDTQPDGSINHHTHTLRSIENVIGTERDDHLYGDSGNNRLEGKEGDDRIYGRAGDDYIISYSGNDVLVGGDGSDTFHIHTSRDDNQIEINDFDYREGDRLEFTGVWSHLDTTSGSPAFGRSWDTENGALVIKSESGNTRVKIWGAERWMFDPTQDHRHDPVYRGTDGADIHAGFRDHDEHFHASKGADRIDGGAGSDTYDLSAHDKYGGFTVNLSDDSQEWVQVGDYNFPSSTPHRDTIRGIENVIGSQGNDWIEGNSENNVIRGGAGWDVAHGGAGDDVLEAEIMHGGSGADTLILGNGHWEYRIRGYEHGVDTIQWSFDITKATSRFEGDDLIVTSGPLDLGPLFVGDPRISVRFVDASENWFARVEPEPEVEPAPEPEPVVEPADETESPASSEQPTEPEPQVPSYNPVARIPDSTDGFNIVDGRNPAEVTGAQELSGTNRKDWIRGSDGKDVLRGNSGRDYLEGSGGNDFLSGGNARDWLVGGRGGDRLQGGKQDDILTGNQGRDTFVFKAKHGRDIVTDFFVGKDTLELQGVEFSDLTIKKWAKGTGARVEWDEGVIYLEGVQRDSLTEDSFEFV